MVPLIRALKSNFPKEPQTGVVPEAQCATKHLQEIIAMHVTRFAEECGPMRDANPVQIPTYLDINCALNTLVQIPKLPRR